jgi:adenosylhomocysteinase
MPVNKNLQVQFPLLQQLSTYLKPQANLSGLHLGWHCHLTDLTAQAADVLISCGARLFLSECNPDTSDPAAIKYMLRQGAVVYTGAGSCRQVLTHQPQILSDTGLELISAYLNNSGNKVFAACEITTSGITRLRQIEHISLPVININGGQLKQFIENFHGVGDGLVESLRLLTNQDWSGAKAAVIGYGSVGSGVASYLQAQGLQVTVVENNPILQLKAHYDGFALSELSPALTANQLIVTATGQESLLGPEEWKLLNNQTYVFNVGHWSNELDLSALEQLSIGQNAISEHLQEYLLAPGKSVFVAAAGNPVNVVLLTGSAEPTLIHLTTEILTVNFLAEQLLQGRHLSSGENPVPLEIEKASARLALQALGLMTN